ncbi:MAG TPA: hypothetical protein DDX91_01465 [Ruminococcaceae bacterium]|nr:hypothetical protein [Oscillospiraceae bacterium]
MNRLKGLLKRVFNPSLRILLPLIPISVVLLIFGLSEEFTGSPVAYISYLLSAYTLTAVICALPKMAGRVKSRFWSLSVIKKINAGKIGHLFLNNIAFRGTVSIYQGLVLNTVYAVFRGIAACLFSSVWFGAISVYYLFLAVIRLFLVLYVRHLKKYRGDAEKLMLFEFKGYRICGFLMLHLNSAMAGMTVLMIRDNLHYKYPGYVIYLSALYTFYSAITASVNIFRFRKLKSPVLSASKAISFTSAAMSVMALQTAMISRFGENDAVFRQTANTATGTVVCAGSVIIAIYMIFRSTYNIKKIKRKKLTYDK